MNVLISTSTFARYSREPLELLESLGANYTLNPKGRKLNTEEITSLLGDVDGLADQAAGG